ncbi:MerR family transcriptional regulator [Rubrivirga sp. IMCC45206]|uniref:MerR family transcriptional regulator n=1 Tax=Rubrivirga sp. IMCC45206 TaxID=3391614 RepID=UPI00398F9C42
MRIGAFADAAGVPVDTVRYYEKRGLLAPPPRTPGGFREYGPDALRRLRALRRAQALGFTLDEASGLLALSSDAHADAGAVRQRAIDKVAEIDARIAEMTKTRDALAALADACGGAATTRAECPVLAALADDTAPAD